MSTNLYLQVGDILFGAGKAAEVPREGGVIDHFIIGGAYLNFIGGGGIGNRWIDELTWDKSKVWPPKKRAKLRGNYEH